MARTLSVALAAKAAQQYGAEPLTIVKIEWASGTRYYSDKAYTFGVNVCEAKILDFGNIVSQVRSDSSSEVASANLSLDDTDATIKNSVNRDLLAGTKCTVYQTYNTLSVADSLVILAGRISNDITWSEGQRTISFTIDTSFYIGELGYAPKKGDLANLSIDAEGQLWPIVFGSCLNVPAVQIYKSIYGDYPNSEAMSFTAGSTFYVTGGENFPTGSIKIRMKQGVCLQGSFTGNLFTVATNNVAYHTNLSIAARVADADELNPSVLWLTGQKYLVGQYCYIDDGANTMSNLCTYQDGKKCWFAKPWKKLGQNAPVALATGIIDETSHFYRTTWTVPFQVEVLVGSIWTEVGYYTTWTTKYAHDVALVTSQIPTYIVNNAASTIKSVYAYRTYLGKRTLEQVPSSYYTKYNSTTISGKTVAALELHNELTDYVDEGWEQEIFVSLTSSLSANTSDVIKYLLETYTSYTTDASFASVATKITNYPSHFAVLNQSDVLSLVADIAYQARLAIRYDGSVAKLYYLSEIPTTVQVFNDDTIAQKTLDYGFTSIDDIVTKYMAKWKPSYTAKDSEYVYKNNGTTFGTKEDTRDYFIYNIESLVVLSANFWGNRVSSSWRTCRLTSFLSALAIECFDCVRVTTGTLAATGIRGEVAVAGHDTMADTIGLEIKLASKSGVHSSGTIIEDTTFFTGSVTGAETMPADPTNGLTERDYVVFHEPKEVAAPANKITKYIKFITTPTKIVRGQAFSISAKIVNQDESIFNVNETFNFTVSTSAGSETPNIGTISFVNGLATVSRSVTGGSTDTEAVLNIVGKTVGTVTYQTALSDGIPITSEPTLTWIVDHTANERGSYFTVNITGGLPSTVYAVTLDSQDPGEMLMASPSIEVTSITTDVSGNANGTWTFQDGTFALNSVRIIATHAGYEHLSPEFMVIDAGGSSALVVEATVAGAYPGDPVYNSGASWVLATSPPDGVTIGVVGMVKPGDVCLIVCRGLMCYPGLTPHTDYNLVGGALATGAGKFVMRSYANDLCWVGGGTAIAKMTDIKDVDNTVTLATQMLLVYNTPANKWVPTNALDFLDSWIYSTDSSLVIDTAGSVIDIKIAAVALNKIAAIASNSILANVTGSTIAPLALTASVDGHVLRLAGTTLGFGLIGNASISDLAWGKLTGVPAYAASVHTHTLVGDVGGDLATNIIGADKITTVKILNGNVTNAKLANSGMTINGTLRSLGDTFTLASSLATLSDCTITTPANNDVLTYETASTKWKNKPGNPMTTSGDMIVGGASGAMTRLAVNAGGTVQFVRSVGGLTELAALTLDAFEGVTITTATQQDGFLFDGTQWRNYATKGKNPAFVGKITSKSSGNIYNITIYPEYPSLAVAWVTTATQLQGDSAQTIPANTWTIVAGAIKTGAYYGTALADYNYFIQVPVWL